MQRARKFRKRLAEAWIVLLALLLLGFSVGIWSAHEARRMNQWVSHTQEVLTEAASVRLHRLRMRNDLWFYRATGGDEFRLRYETERGHLRENTNKLLELTADNPGQHGAINRVGKMLQQQIEVMDLALEKAKSAKQSGERQESTAVIPTDDQLTATMDEFEREERRLFAERSTKVQNNAQWTLDLLLITGFLACGALIVTGYYIQREVLSRAQIEAGLRRARELMGTQLSQRQSELGHTMEDLHLQIEARNRAEEEMKRLNQELETRVAQRTQELREMNQELESFNYSVSHDLRAPLRHLDGFSKILEEEFAPELSTEAKHYLHRIRLAAGQMSNLVEDLLQLARFGRQAVKREQVALRPLVEETIAACLQEEPGREIVWNVELLPKLEADPGLVRQVFANLVANAIKFTRKRKPAVIEIGSQREEDEVTIFVKDNGAGFDPRFSDKLFGVFQRLHRQDEFEGTGIGLAIVVRIIHKHGGRIWAESTLGQGATFYFTLAAKKAERVAVETIGAHA
jgi:signal transduction histidine kinase